MWREREREVCESICIRRALRDPLAATLPVLLKKYTTPWPLHDIVITNIVWCKAYEREVEGGSYFAQLSCNSIETVRAMQAGRKNENTVDSCANDQK